MALYASGYSYKAISETKFMTYRGVYNSLARAVERSGARNLTHLCVILRDTGMIRRSAEGLYEPVQDPRVA